MHCYYHTELNACGVCKSCQRGICRGCAAEVGRSIACIGRCESDVQALDQLMAQSAQIGSDASRLTQSVSMFSVELFNLVIGAIFLAVGVYKQSTWMQVLGGAFLVFGGFGLYRVIKARRNAKN